ncbi:hypothetical protein [Cycloclasticus sp. PY97N]|nr:hypothetical protein [Cycloclasticus sp. PY97N]
MDRRGDIDAISGGGRIGGRASGLFDSCQESIKSLSIFSMR